MSNEADVCENYFKSLIILFGRSGLWVPTEKIPWRNSRYQPIINYAIMGFSWLILFPSSIMDLTVAENHNVFMNVLRDVISYGVVFVKYLYFYGSRKQISDLIINLQMNNYRYEDYEDFVPNEILKQNINEIEFFENVFYFLVIVICTSLGSAELTTFFIRGGNFYKDGIDTYKPELLRWTPFHSESTGLIFLYGLIINILCIFFLGTITVSIDFGMAHTLSCISAHFYVLQGAFRTIRERCIKRVNTSPALLENIITDPIDLQMEMEAEMKKCIHHLQFLYKATFDAEAIFSGQTLFQLTCSIMSLSFCLYFLQVSDTTGQFHEIWFYSAVSFQLLFYCWFAEKITDASDGLPQALFESDWLSTSKRHKRSILITLTVLHKPVYVSVGQFYPLTFSTFISIMKTAYSAYTVLGQTSN